MRAELVAEADKEAEMYDKMVCWCETNEKEKTGAVAEAEGRIGDLMSEMEARAAAKGELSTKITAMKAQIAEDTESLKTATAMREKEAAAFSNEEKEMMQAVTNLKNAITVLSKHQTSSSLLQLDSPELASVRAVVEDASLKYDLLQGDHPRRLRASKRESTAALLSIGSQQGMDKAWASVLDLHGESAVPLDIAQRMLARAAKDAKASGSSFVQGSGEGPASYAPQSSQIFGILKQMSEDFENNLSQAQKDEMKAAADFQELARSKSSQLSAGKDKLDSLEGNYAENLKALSDAKEDYELTTGKRASDVEFLRNLRLTCQDLDRQWAERSKTRGEEIKAVGEALAVLTEDDNREHLAKTVTFLQEVLVSDSVAQARRTSAMAILRSAMHQPAFKTDDLMAAWSSRSVGGATKELATLAVSMQLDSFAKVKEMMDKMVADLKKEQSEEVSFKDNCQTEFNTNEKTTMTKKEEKADLEANIEKLTKLIETLQEEIKTAKANIADSEVAIKKASETREKENTEFQTTIADQRATQAILTKALAKLEAFYKKKAALLASKSAVKQEPPVKFNSYKKNAGSSGVMGLLEQIIEDSKALEKEAVAGETEAQASYESFVKDSNALIAQLSEAVTAKSKAVSASEVELEQAKADLNSTDEEIASLEQFRADLHQQCDFVTKNFNIRQAARLQEIEAIQQAKAILSGADDA
jgi:chromosome segregation ATPase